jgi:hypothetical protein
MDKSELKPAILAALRHLGGNGSVTEIARFIWENHEAELRSSGDLFYTWQYDMRWAGQFLQKEGKLSKKGDGRRWSIVR